jgi:hypothetical protein
MQKKGTGFSPCGTLFGEKASFSRFSAACSDEQQEPRNELGFTGYDKKVSG